MERLETFAGLKRGDVLVSLEKKFHHSAKIFRNRGTLYQVLYKAEASVTYDTHYSRTGDTHSYGPNTWRKATEAETKAYYKGIYHIDDIVELETDNYDIY